MDNFAFARVLSLHVEALGIVVEVEAMKAANADREHRGEAQAYPESSFQLRADGLRYVSTAMEEMTRG